MTTNEFERLESDLEAAFAVAVPALKLNAGTDRSGALRPHGRRRSWGFAGGAALAAGVVAAVAFLPGFLGGAKPVNAEELLARSAEASADLQASTTPYHLRARFEGAGTNFVAETWSFGTAGNRSESRDLDGQLLYGQVATTSDFWLYATIDGALRVTHVPGATVRLNDFVAGTDSIDGIVRGLTFDGCQKASLEGTATVAGRETFVVEVQPTPDRCKSPDGQSTTKKEVGWAMKLGGYSVWIDKETNVQLQVEYRDESGSVARRYTAESFETGRGVSTDILTFVPPAGATVIEAANYSEAKSALYAGTSETHRTAPINTK